MGMGITRQVERHRQHLDVSPNSHSARYNNVHARVDDHMDSATMRATHDHQHDYVRENIRTYP